MDILKGAKLDLEHRKLYQRQYWHLKRKDNCPQCGRIKTKKAVLCRVCENKSRIKPNTKSDSQCHKEAKLSNPEKYKERERLYRQMHPENMALKQRRWREMNHLSWLLSARLSASKRYAAKFKKEPSEFTQSDWLNLLSEYNNACAYCGSKTNMTVDHVIPLCGGGAHTKSNIVPCCRKCNTLKGIKTKENFMQQLSYSY